MYFFCKDTRLLASDEDSSMYTQLDSKTYVCLQVYINCEYSPTCFWAIARCERAECVPFVFDEHFGLLDAHTKEMVVERFV